MLLACLFMGASVVTAQTSKVTGLVISAEDNEPVIGATVAVKGVPTMGTVTDIDGKFVIENLPSTAKTLVVSYVGMMTQEVAIKQNVKIILESDVEHLDEVMVVAFGTAKKSQFTGSAGTIKADKITERQVSNVSNALSGQIAGVQTTATNGEPGASATVRIRGIGSMSASNAPLYVVDGVPFEGNIATINPQDIESMTVLKDAASNALYGARGANGVILITTKKGQSGSKAKIDVDAKWGTNRRAIPNYDVMTDADMYYETFYQGINNALGGNAPSDKVGAYVENFLGYPIYNIPEGEQLFTAEGKINPNATLGNKYVGSDGKTYFLQPDNWYDELFMNDNQRQEYNVRISGASPQSTYFMSAGYLEDTGIIPNSGFQRFSARMNADYQVNNRVKVGSSFSYVNTLSLSPRDQSGSSSGNLFYISNMIAPIYPLYVRNEDGSIKIDDYGFTTYDFGAGEYPGLGRPFMGNSNPASMIALDKYKTVSDVLSGRAFLNWEIAKGLKASANWGVDVNNSRNNNLYNTYYGQYSATGGIIYVTAARTFSTNQQYLLTYNREFGNHSFDALAGYENYQRTYQYLSASKENLYNPNVPEIDNAISQPSASSYTGVYNTQGILARLQYDYADKYFVSGSFRRDASSRFHPDHRWGDFYSFGAGWLINKESWFDVEWVDELKLKASIGQVGNDNIGNYLYTDTYQITTSGGNVGSYFYSKGTEDITWETNTSFNAGIEFGFFNNRISGGIEYFNRMTTDMLFPTPVAPSQGYSSIYKNVGDMNNYGVETDLHFVLVNNKNVQWDFNLNASYLKNTVVSLADNVKDSKAYDAEGNEYEGFTSGSFFVAEGSSMYTWNTYDYAGIDPETGKSLWWKNVFDDEGKITGREKTDDFSTASKYMTGKSTLAPLFGGFGTSISAYGFDFAINFTYQVGGKQLDGSYMTFMYSPTSSQTGFNYHVDLLDAWTPENKNATVPRFQYGDSYSNATSTRFLTSASYLNLQNVNFGYTLPARLTKKFLVSSLRLYVSAENLYYWSARKGFDPRQSFSSSTTATTYSPMRTVSGGITVKF